MEDVRKNPAYVPLMAAVEELATTRLKVLMLIKQGTLDGKMVDGEWQVSRPSLDCLKAHGIEPQARVSCRTSCTASSCGCT